MRVCAPRLDLGLQYAAIRSLVGCKYAGRTFRLGAVEERVKW